MEIVVTQSGFKRRCGLNGWGNNKSVNLGLSHVSETALFIVLRLHGYVVFYLYPRLCQVNLA